MKKRFLVLVAVLFLMAVDLYAAPGDVNVEGYLYVPNRPAFSISLSNNWTAGGVIKFDLIVVNNGNHYDPSTGRFTAPVSGLYQICFGGRQDSDSAYQTSYADIRVNGSPVPGGRAYSRGKTDTEPYDFSFKCIILNLAAGDYVDIQNMVSGVGWAASPYTLFSGHLL